MTIRSDNADLRLTEKGTIFFVVGKRNKINILSLSHLSHSLTLFVCFTGRIAGAVSDHRWSHFISTRDEIARVTEVLKAFMLTSHVRTPAQAVFLPLPLFCIPPFFGY